MYRNLVALVIAVALLVLSAPSAFAKGPVISEPTPPQKGPVISAPEEQSNPLFHSAWTWLVEQVERTKPPKLN